MTREFESEISWQDEIMQDGWPQVPKDEWHEEIVEVKAGISSTPRQTYHMDVADLNRAPQEVTVLQEKRYDVTRALGELDIAPHGESLRNRWFDAPKLGLRPADVKRLEVDEDTPNNDLPHKMTKAARNSSTKRIWPVSFSPTIRPKNTPL